MTTESDESKAIKNTRESIARLMKLMGNAANGMPSKRIAFAFQNVISQIPDKIIYSVLKDPNLKLETHRKPKPSNENHAARKTKTRHN